MLFLSEKLNDPRIPGKILFNEDENAHLPPHWHSNVDICFFLQGGFCARIDGQCYTVQNQDLILVNSGQLHHVGENSVGERRGISLVADMDFWHDFCPELDSLEFSLSICPERVPELKQLMTALYDASCTYYCAKESHRDSGAASRELLQIHGLICMVYYTLTKYFSRPQKTASHRLAVQKSSLQDVIQYINTHYTEPLMLKDIADQYNFSCEHLSRLFRKKLGLTFKEYLYSIRLTHACRLLTHTEKSILDISLEAGFPDMRAFSQQFNRVYHTTPKEYRRRFRHT